nr:YqaJ viral recombinase family protein [uncultured Halomonas sp.]
MSVPTTKHYHVINLEQGSDAWLDWRQNGITATDATVLLGVNPHKSKWQLWAEKTGFQAPPDLSNNPNVKRGNALEPIIRGEYEAQTGEMLLPVCVQSTKSPQLRASLDGITADGRPVEIKAPGAKVWDDLAENGREAAAFKMYAAQVQHQLLCVLATQAVLVFGRDVEGKIELMSFDIQRDTATCKALLQASLTFWKQVTTESAPDKDPVLDKFLPQGEDADAWRAAAAEYRSYQAEIDALNERVKELKAQQRPASDTLLALLGDNAKSGEYAGVLVTRYEQEGAVDYKKAVEMHTDLSEEALDGFRKRSSMRSRITVTEDTSPRLVQDENVKAHSATPVKVVADAFF